MAHLLIDHIVSDSDHRRGKPRINGTGITVQNIVEDIAAGLSLEYITEQFELTLGQVHAALSYYYDHKNEIDAAIEEDKQTAQTIQSSKEYAASKEHQQQIKAELEARRTNR